MFDMHKIGIAIVASAVTLAIGTPAHAASFNNGDFGTGDFKGWTTAGNTDVFSSQFNPQPTNGAPYEAQITSYDSGGVYLVDTSPSDLETQLGLPTSSLQGQGLNVLSGSGIAQTVALNAGQRVLFDYDFLTNEPAGTANGVKYNDFAFFQTSSDTGYTSPLQVIASVAGSKFNNTTSAPDFAIDTGFQNYSFTAPTSGNYTIKVGVTNVGPGSNGGDSDSFSSGILATNFTVAAPVPEPAFTPGILSLFAVGAVLRYHRSRKQK